METSAQVLVYDDTNQILDLMADALEQSDWDCDDLFWQIGGKDTDFEDNPAWEGRQVLDPLTTEVLGCQFHIMPSHSGVMLRSIHQPLTADPEAYIVCQKVVELFSLVSVRGEV